MRSISGPIRTTPPGHVAHGEIYEGNLLLPRALSTRERPETCKGHIQTSCASIALCRGLDEIDDRPGTSTVQDRPLFCSPFHHSRKCEPKMKKYMYTDTPAPPTYAENVQQNHLTHEGKSKSTRKQAGRRSEGCEVRDRSPTKAWREVRTGLRRTGSGTLLCFVLALSGKVIIHRRDEVNGPDKLWET